MYNSALPLRNRHSRSDMSLLVRIIRKLHPFGATIVPRKVSTTLAGPATRTVRANPGAPVTRQPSQRLVNSACQVSCYRGANRVLKVHDQGHRSHSRGSDVPQDEQSRPAWMLGAPNRPVIGLLWREGYRARSHTGLVVRARLYGFLLARLCFPL